MEHNNINLLVSKYLLGTATPEELSALKQMIIEYPHIAELLKKIEEEDGLLKHYSEYMEVDKDKALFHFKEKMSVTPEIISTEETTQRNTSFFVLHSYLLRIAAVVLCLIAVGAGWWYMDYTKVTPPEIAQEVRKAMEQSEVSGKNMARVETFSDFIQEESMRDNESPQQLAQVYEIIQENYNLEDPNGSLNVSIAKANITKVVVNGYTGKQNQVHSVVATTPEAMTIGDETITWLYSTNGTDCVSDIQVSDK